ISSEREELLRQDYVCDLEWYWEKLNLEPFWWNGYKEALGLCLKHKKYAEALQICNRCALFYPTEKIYPWLKYLSNTINLPLDMLKEMEISIQRLRDELSLCNLKQYLQYLRTLQPELTSFLTRWEMCYIKQDKP
ncbi:MAG: hypothetical protein Q9M37_08880, partial [Desulfonauticus sp.]|nr:hypothetical protein [Desulfonauticus sp.]